MTLAPTEQFLDERKCDHDFSDDVASWKKIGDVLMTDSESQPRCDDSDVDWPMRLKVPMQVQPTVDVQLTGDDDKALVREMIYLFSWAIEIPYWKALRRESLQPTTIHSLSPDNTCQAVVATADLLTTAIFTETLWIDDARMRLPLTLQDETGQKIKGDTVCPGYCAGDAVTIAAAPLKVETGEDLRPVMLQVGGDLGCPERTALLPGDLHAGHFGRAPERHRAAEEAALRWEMLKSEAQRHGLKAEDLCAPSGERLLSYVQCVGSVGSPGVSKLDLESGLTICASTRAPSTALDALDEQSFATAEMVSEITSMVDDITWHATTATARKRRQNTAALAASPGFRDGEESKRHRHVGRSGHQ
ncbi:unnamed protein product [Cladocopium goreaui]|uniref:Uncharacterized protein n=1 Tax=Cladocopium goreaui TaxID=2562237 RepID=A0A9P1D5X7_9DINO|nr:unnamed protein product [Cladocopium goreaui]